MGEEVLVFDNQSGSMFRSSKEALEEATKKVNASIASIGEWKTTDDYKSVQDSLEQSVRWCCDNIKTNAALKIVEDFFDCLGIPVHHHEALEYARLWELL